MRKLILLQIIALLAVLLLFGCGSEPAVKEEAPAKTAEAEETFEVAAPFDHSTVIKGSFETARYLTALPV